MIGFLIQSGILLVFGWCSCRAWDRYRREREIARLLRSLRPRQAVTS